MEYHIVHRQPNLSAQYYWEVREDLLAKMVRAYLRGETEITTSGKTYRVGSIVFRIYETTEKQGVGGVIINSLEKLQVAQSKDIESYFELHFRDVTHIFLRGMNWGDLKEDLYNVYLNTGDAKRVKLAVEKDELQKFIDKWHNGEQTGWLGASNFALEYITTFQIFDIDIAYRMQSVGETKKLLKNEKNKFSGEWKISHLEAFGKEVTTDFKIGPYGSKSILTTSAVDARFDWSLIHIAIRDEAQSRFESQHFADSVEAAFKEINDIVKKEFIKLGNEELDGLKLMRTVFSPANPKIKLTPNITESERNIHEGYMNIFAGVMIGIRNPKAHANVVIDEKDAWEKIVIASHFNEDVDQRIIENEKPAQTS